MKTMLLSLLISFLGVLVLGPVVIPMLKKLKLRSTERYFGNNQSFAQKNGTPIMGGIMMMPVIFIVSLVFAQENVRFSFLLPVLLLILAFSLLGLTDDLLKSVGHKVDGLAPWQKVAVQLVLSFLAAFFCYKSPYVGSSIYIPFTTIEADLGWWYIPFTMFVLIAATNSVNLIDGVDGLCSSVTTAATLTLGLCALFMNQAGLIPESSSCVMVLACATAGVCLGFLRFNTYPAKIFMGDTGSFALGAAYTMAAILLRQPLLILPTGIMFVITSLSDIYQAFSIKFRHRRPLRMAPLHSHLSLKGMPESRIVVLYVLTTVVFCAVALLALC